MCRWEEGVPSPESLMGGRRRRPSLKALGVAPPPLSPSPRSPFSAGFFFVAGGKEEEEGGHFLDSCFLCRRPLTADCDIFMYRGDTPFCSEECRGEQMEVDELQERRRRGRKVRVSAGPKVERCGSIRTFRDAEAVMAG